MSYKCRAAVILPALLFSLCLFFPRQAQASSIEDILYTGGEVPGQEAYEFDRYLGKNFAHRVNDEGARSETLNQAGQWISSQLESFGYEVIEVPYEHFDYTGIDYAVLKKGTLEDSYIVVSAHYDCVEATEGVDDNGSGTSCVLEMAKHFAGVETPMSIYFVLFDGEEHGGYVGSYHFLEDFLDPNGLTDKVFCNINIDSVGGGDRLFAYGGFYDEEGALQNDWVYREANKAAHQTGTPLYTLSDLVEIYQTPTRISGSDHHYFNVRGIPYIYMEASRWCLEDGSGGNEHSNRHYHFQSADPRLSDTGGQIMHMKYDNFDLLEELFPGRLQFNLGSVVKIVSRMLLDIGPDTPEQVMAEEISFEPVSLAEETETEEPTTEEPVLAEASSEEPATEAEQTTTVRESESRPVTPGDHRLVRTLFLIVGIVLILIILFLIYWSITAGRRRRKHIHRSDAASRKNNKKKFE